MQRDDKKIFAKKSLMFLDVFGPHIISYVAAFLTTWKVNLEFYAYSSQAFVGL